jgi:predicted transcriptional regulator
MAEEDRPLLTAAQRAIMQVIWRRGEATVSEVREALAPRRVLARNTVQTMIVRLEEKGWLKHREDGRTFVYSANRSRTVSLGAKVAQLVDRWFAGAPEEMVTALLEYRGLTADEAERIRQMIAAAEIKKEKNSGRE